MFSMHFLAAAKPLVKSFSLNPDNTINKESYPIVKNFTSYDEPITNLKDVYDAVLKHSKLNHCALKGKLHSALMNEPRASTTKSTDETQWVLIDLDNSPYKTPEDFMLAHPVLKDVSYVVQYSASQGIVGLYDDPKLSCHLFMLLDKPIAAPLLKNWLTAMNLENNTNKSALSLTRTASTLRYPIDITTCQNDKIIYIAPPKLGKGVKCKITDSERIQYVKKTKDRINTAALMVKGPEAIQKEKQEILNTLRDAAGYKKLSLSTKWVGEFNVQTKPGEAQITGIKTDEDAGYVRFNLNGGDSWSYYHPINNYELIHCFKHQDISFLTKELLPDYYKECQQERAAAMAAPTVDGDLLLAFRDLKSATYWNGTWNEKTHKLNLHRAKDTTQLDHYLMANGYPDGVGKFVPTWNIEFNPQSKYIVDVENKKLNTYIETEYLRDKHVAVSWKDLNAKCPIIMRVIKSAISGNEENEVLEFFMNWLAVMFQKRNKTFTAFILTGTYGTGKNVLVENIIRPILGEKYVLNKRAVELEENYTGYLEQALVAFIDEIHIPASSKKEKIMADLFSQITGLTTTYRNMHSMPYEGPNYTTFIMSSNHPDPIKIEHNDRRFNFSIYQPEKLEITDDEVRKSIPKELTTFCHYIMTRKADAQLARSILHHETRTNIINTGKTSLDEIGESLIKGDIESLWNSMPDLNLVAELHGSNSAVASAYANLIKREIEITFRERATYRVVGGRKIPVKAGLVVCHSKLTRDELAVIFEHCVGNMPNTPNKFTSLLRHRGITIENVRINDNIMRGIHVEWKIEERKLKELYDQIEKSKTPLKLVAKAKVT